MAEPSKIMLFVGPAPQVIWGHVRALAPARSTVYLGVQGVLFFPFRHGQLALIRAAPFVRHPFE